MPVLTTSAIFGIVGFVGFVGFVVFFGIVGIVDVIGGGIAVFACLSWIAVRQCYVKPNWAGFIVASGVKTTGT